tara:strand:+ start:2371 stop:3414 length:1044 start_codon:yes stop_codon:yes gene_type:complete
MVDLQISTARKYPRDVDVFVQTVAGMALRDEETAGKCIYGLPRAGKVIEGPSVRFAEIIVAAWKNVRADVQALPVGPKDTECTSVATFFDLETNVAIRIATKRRIVNKENRRYSDDMIVMTQNANNSIAFRNAVFKGIPEALWDPIYDRARVLALGEGGTIIQKRQDMISWFSKLGIQEAAILKRLDVASAGDINVDELVKLKGLANAIKDGEITAEQAFSTTGAAPEQPSGLKERLERQGNGKTSDADIANRAKAKKAEQDAEQAEASEGGAPEHPAPPPPTDDPNTISRQKATALKKKAEAANVSEAELLDHVSIAHEVSSLEELTGEQADAVGAWLDGQGELQY